MADGIGKISAGSVEKITNFLSGICAPRAVGQKGRNLVRILQFGIAAAVALGQGFDVVDVRVAKPLAAGTVQVMLSEGPAVVELNPGGVSRILAAPFGEGGTVTLRYYTMRLLVTAAYKEVVRDEFIVGGPGWLDSDHYDVIAKTAPGTSLDTMRLMLQEALSDKFHLVVHREQRTMSSLVLTEARSGLKLKSSSSLGRAECGALPAEPDGLRHWVCQHTPIEDLVERLPILAPAYVDQPVINLTGLSGAYDFQLDWYPKRDSGVPGATIFDALDKLGLKLEERKQPMPVIVIDHVDRTPTEN